MKWIPLAAALAWGALAGPAAAQIFKCVDAAGRTVLTDGSCSAGQRQSQVAAQRSPEDLAAEAQQAHRSRQEFLDRQQRELQAQQNDLQRQRFMAEQNARAAPSQGLGPYECTRAQREADVAASSTTGTDFERQHRIEQAQRHANLACYGPQQAAAIEAARAARPVIVAPAPYYYHPGAVVPRGQLHRPREFGAVINPDGSCGRVGIHARC